MTYPPLARSHPAVMPLFMSAADLAARFPSETDRVEYKSGLSRTAVQEAVVAFTHSDLAERVGGRRRRPGR